MQKIIVGINCVPFNAPKPLHRQKVAVDVLLANKPDNVEVINFCYPNEEMPEFSHLRTIHLKRNSKEERF